jgi:hypothetical protein
LPAVSPAENNCRAHTPGAKQLSDQDIAITGEDAIAFVVDKVTTCA